MFLFPTLQVGVVRFFCEHVLLSSSLINVFAVEVENVTGIRAEITYDNNILQVSDVARGDLFGQNSQNSLFFVNFQDNPGTIVIDYFYKMEKSFSLFFL